MKNEKQLKRVVIDEFLGLNTEDDPTLISEKESPYMLNMDIIKHGKMITRFGYEQVATKASAGAVRGMIPYYKTYDDNTSIDQSLDTGGAYSNTYTLPAAISEGATNRQTFTPTLSPIHTIGVWVVSKGSSGTVTLTLHDASNNVLASKSKDYSQLTNGAFNYFTVPYTWTSGALHFHVTNTTGTTTIKTNTSSDMEDASFIETYSSKGDFLLFACADANVYSVTNANWTPSTLGSLGTDDGQVRGTVFNNIVILGNGNVANSVKKWAGISTLSNLGGLVPDANIFCTYQKRVFAVSPSTPSVVYYTDVDTAEAWASGAAGNITVEVGNGEDIKSMIPHNDSLQILKENSIHSIAFSFDSSYNLTIPQQQPTVSRSGGCIATGSAVPVYNYTYYLSNKGFQSFGVSPEGVDRRSSFPLSRKINPTVEEINLAYRDNINGTFFDDKYLCAVPLGTSSVNNYVFVYNDAIKREKGIDSWSLYNGIPASTFAIFRDSNKKDQLYFGSAYEPNIYKFNTSFSDAGAGYLRAWRSKTFRFGDKTYYAFWDVEGSKAQGAEITAAITTDNNTATYTIDDSNLLNTTSGSGYIGDNYIGDAYIGGAEAGETTPLYRFKARIPFTDSVNFGYESFLELYNQAEGQGWKIDRLTLYYSPEPVDPTFNNFEV